MIDKKHLKITDKGKTEHAITRLFTKIKAYAEITKPQVNILYTVLTLAGGYLASNTISLDMLKAAAAVTLGGLGSYALNDLFDIEVDRINEPDRPLPSGRISKGEVQALVIILLASSLALAASINTQTLMYVTIPVLIGIAYSAPPLRLKGRLLANPIIALALSSCILAGASIVNITPKAVLAAVTMGIFVVCAYPIKDLKDFNGDKAKGIKTLPVRLGLKRTLKLITITTFLGLAPMYLGYTLGEWNHLYPLLVLALTAVFTRSLITIWRKPGRASACKKAWKGYIVGAILIPLSFILGSIPI